MVEVGLLLQNSDLILVYRVLVIPCVLGQC